MATSTLHFYFQNIHFTDETLETNRRCNCVFCCWYDYDAASTILRPRCLCSVFAAQEGWDCLIRASFSTLKTCLSNLSVLNNVEQTQHTAKQSLESHVKKRQIMQTISIRRILLILELTLTIASSRCRRQCGAGHTDPLQ